ncbi:MAG: hypothetical protein WCA00_13580 [Candidatus Acidiferrales bacterium]
MKILSRVIVCMLLGAILFAPRAAAQNGSLQFVARITPSGGVDEPVRSFPFYLLSKSYADIQKEAAVTAPGANKNAFIASLEVSKELKAWMKANQWVNLSGEDFVKKLKPDDVMNVPEFFAAYVERMIGDSTVVFPTPKYKPEDKTKDPEKYARLRKQYLDAVRAFLVLNPTSTDGIDLSLEDVNPGHKWDMLKARGQTDTSRETKELAKAKYLVARADTDLQGQGYIRGLRPGNYWLSTLDIDAIAGDARERWDVAVTVRPGGPTFLTLSNVNAAPDEHASMQ